MPGVAEANEELRQDFLAFAVTDADELRDGRLSIVAIEKRLDRCEPLAMATFVFPFGVLLMDISGIAQHDVAQRGRRLVGIDGPRVAMLDEQRQPA